MWRQVGIHLAKQVFIVGVIVSAAGAVDSPPPPRAPAAQPPAQAAITLPTIDPDKVYVQGFIERESFDVFADALMLSEAQRAHADRAYEQYVTSMKVLNAEERQRRKKMSDDVGWAPEGYVPPGYDDMMLRADARRGRRYRTPEQQHELNMRSTALTLDIQSTAKLHDRRLIDDVAEALAEGQFDLLPAATRSLRRAVFHQGERRGIQDDFSVRDPNMRALVHDAMMEGSELWLLNENNEDASTPVPVRAAVRQQVEDIVAGYELTFDRLIDGLIERRTVRSQKELEATAADDEARMRQIEREDYQEWRRRCDASLAAARSIADALRASGVFDEGRVDAWLDRMHAAWCPQLFREESSERLFQWLCAADMNDETRQAIRHVYEGYVSSRKALRADAMDVRLRLREFRYFAYMPNTRPEVVPLWERRDAIESRRRELCDRTNALFRSLLIDEKHRQSFDRVLSDFRGSRPSDARFQIP